MSFKFRKEQVLRCWREIDFINLQ